MPLGVPEVRQIVAASATVANLLSAIYTDLNSFGVYHTIQDSAGTLGDQGILISNNLSLFQGSVRASGTSMNGAMDPGNGITVSGTSASAPTGGSAELLTDRLIFPLATYPVDKTFYVIEDERYILYMFMTTATTAQQWLMGWGQHWTPFTPSFIADGRKGLAQIGGLPTFSTSFSNYAILNAGGTNTSWFQFKTDEWYGASMSFTPSNTVDADGDTDVAPLQIKLQNIFGSGDKDVGYMNWFGYWSSSDVPKVVENTATSDQGWMHINTTTSATLYVMVWNQTVVPS